MTKILCLILFLSSLATFAVAKNSQVTAPKNDQYWISYAVGNLSFLMKIDSGGKVIVAPTQIMIPPRLHLSTKAISKNGVNFLNVWMSVEGGRVYRAVIDKRTFKLTKLIKTAITTNTDVDVTQKATNNFVVIEKPIMNNAFDFDFVAQGVSPTGVVNSGPWLIAANAFLYDAFCCSSRTVSSDGKTVAWFEPIFIMRNSNLSIRLLDDSGRPSGPAITLASDAVARHSTVSLSNALPRVPFLLTFVAYTWSTSSGTTPLFLQAIDALDGSAVGSRIHLRGGKIGALAIDPLGRFVLFTAPNKGVPFFFFQALDLTGHGKGPARVLLRNIRIDRIDILKQ